MKPILALILALHPLLHAEEEAPVNMQHVRAASAWLQNADPAKRKAAISTFRTMPGKAMTHYQTALKAAIKVHLDRIEQIDKSDNKLAEHDEIARQLDENRARVMPLIRTDYHKDGRKVKMLRDEMEGLLELYQKREKLAKSDVTALLTAMNGSIDAVCQLTREQEKLDPQMDTKELDEEELRERVIKDSLEADHLTQMHESFEKSRKEITDLAAVEKHNAENGKWCNGSMKAFATVLNLERTVIGLRPLRIEEKLSAAAEGHSSDMASGGFFAHESPVPNKKTPWDRAKLAQFDGNASGENIFMGSTDPNSAYGGWFGSDGHRFIMFSEGPNCCGVGVSGVHWTFMTGSKNGW